MTLKADNMHTLKDAHSIVPIMKQLPGTCNVQVLTNSSPLWLEEFYRFDNIFGPIIQEKKTLLPM